MTEKDRRMIDKNQIPNNTLKTASKTTHRSEQAEKNKETEFQNNILIQIVLIFLLFFFCFLFFN